MYVHFRQFKTHDIPVFYAWAEKTHVKEEWFKEGYEPKESILKKLDDNTTTFPFMVCLNEKDIGYIQYYMVNNGGYEIYKKERDNTVGFDLFIGEENYLNKGYGTQIVRQFSQMLLTKPEVGKIIVDPFIYNTRAIRCYEKAGFNFYKEDFDDNGAKLYVMQKLKNVD